MLKLRVAFSENPRLVPLLDGRVQVAGVELDVELDNPGAMFNRHLKDDDFDVFEFSLADYLVTRERGDGNRWDWTAVPIFLSKAFMFLGIQIRDDAGIESPTDLRGKRVGVPDFSATAGLWFRAALRELCGIASHEIEWFQGSPPATSHANILGLDREELPGITVHYLQQAGQIERLLEAGELDAAYSPRAGSLDRIKHVHPLFEDEGRAFMSQFFARKGFMPANHLVAMQRKLAEREPWLPEALFEALEQSKQAAYERAAAGRAAYLLFSGQDFERQAEMFGSDPYPSGLRANQHMLETATQQSFEEGLTRYPAAPDQLFWGTVRNT